MTPLGSSHLLSPCVVPIPLLYALHIPLNPTELSCCHGSNKSALESNRLGFKFGPCHFIAFDKLLNLSEAPIPKELLPRVGRGELCAEASTQQMLHKQ